MNQIGELVKYWHHGTVQSIQQKVEEVEKDYDDNSFLILCRGDLNSREIDALESFYDCDLDFL
ncbi:hypothetical protein PMIT1303_00681 [Prochlorococcus sp. MIT 1303]|nr:hypothetical protein PMIT1303_00681 [Prochlorococcus sp. MIT 1303]